MGATLFPGADERQPEGKELGARRGAPRLVKADRRQVLLRPTDLESLVPAEHRVRAIWAFVETLKLDLFYEDIRAVEGHGGRPAIDPHVLLALWVFATIEGVGSARHLARLCEEHAAYQWICGGITPNHHTLADFRTKHVDVLDDLLSQSVAVLMKAGAVKLERVAQDGLRVRAHAAAASFRSRDALETCLEEAREQVRRLRDEIDDDPGRGSRRSQKAQERAAKEREARVAEALSQWEEVQRRRSDGDASQARASTTDPEARVMRMADGGYRPAYNAQFACDTSSQVIVGVGVTQSGSDVNQVPPMLEQVRRRTGRRPRRLLVDGGFASREAVESCEAQGVALFAPPMKPRAGRRPGCARPGDTPALRTWRRRMAQPAAAKTYRHRAASIECVNAIARNRGLRQLLVRGVEKVRSVLLLFALAHNVFRAYTLQPALAARA